MKIRIKGNSIRIRLGKSEVDHFGKEGYLEERTVFGSSVFIYALQRGEAPTLSASFANNTITLLVPAGMAHEWTTTDKVGYSHTMDTGNGSTLFLLLEKDFKCIDGEVLEDQSDNYENPLHSCE